MSMAFQVRHEIKADNRHHARDARRARSHEKTCLHCGDSFTAGDVRREVCDLCMKMHAILDNGRIVRVIMQASGKYIEREK
jgi:hypothetical protein